MILPLVHSWPVGALVRDRGDTSPFAPLIVLGYLASGQVQTISVAPPPWATLKERGIRACWESTLESCPASR